MNIAMVLMAVTLAGGVQPDTVPDPFAVYAPVLADAAGQAPVRPEWPLVLNAVVDDPCVGACRRARHDPEMLGRLIGARVVRDTFSGDGYRTVCPPGTCTFVRLASIIPLEPGSQVKVIPGGRVPGVPLDRALAAIPDSMAVPVDAAVDVILHTPCPEPPGSDRCRVPDIVGYRYFLQRTSDGAYVVMGRWFTYAV